MARSEKHKAISLFLTDPHSKNKTSVRLRNLWCRALSSSFGIRNLFKVFAFALDVIHRLKKR